MERTCNREACSVCETSDHVWAFSVRGALLWNQLRVVDVVVVIVVVVKVVVVVVVVVSVVGDVVCACCRCLFVIGCCCFVEMF